MRPRIQHQTTPAYGSEVYTILGHKEIFFYKRVEAVLKTQAVAKQKRTAITMLLNGVPFAKFERNGAYTYIYDPAKDKKSSPALKQLFITKGIAVNDRGLPIRLIEGLDLLIANCKNHNALKA